MFISELIRLIRWDIRVNYDGPSWDNVRAVMLLTEVRLEQFVYILAHQHRLTTTRLLWFALRFLGSLFQWFLCSSNIPGSVTIGRGLRLPHPQNIVIAGTADIGDFCTIYQNTLIAWNGFMPTQHSLPKIGSRVLIGAGAIVIGAVEIGDDVLIGAGATVTRSIPSCSRVTSLPPVVKERPRSDQAARPGSPEHIKDPYSIWR